MLSGSTKALGEEVQDPGRAIYDNTDRILIALKGIEPLVFTIEVNNSRAPICGMTSNRFDQPRLTTTFRCCIDEAMGL